MPVIQTDILKFPKYEIHFFEINNFFSIANTASFFAEVQSSFDLDFSQNAYHKLFKIKKFPNIIPRSGIFPDPLALGDLNGYSLDTIGGTGSRISQPLFEKKQDYTFLVDANENQNFYSNCFLEIFFERQFNFPVVYWSNKQDDSAYYELIDFPKRVFYRERFYYRSVSFGSTEFRYAFKIGLYFAYENDPELLLYI